MKRKLYLDIAVFIVILGGFGAFFFLQQQAPATETQTQDAANASAVGCCGAYEVEGETSLETAGGCCGTPAPDTAQSDEVGQTVLIILVVVTNTVLRVVPHVPLIVT